MTIALSASARLRVGTPGRMSFTAKGIASDLATTWFILGFKRTTGAPTTVGDLVDKFQRQFFDCDRGSFAWGDTATVTCVLERLSAADFFPSALAGDHAYLLVTSNTAEPPGPETPFDAVKALGPLGA